MSSSEVKFVLSRHKPQAKIVSRPKPPARLRCFTLSRRARRAGDVLLEQLHTDMAAWAAFSTFTHRVGHILAMLRDGAHPQQAPRDENPTPPAPLTDPG